MRWDKYKKIGAALSAAALFVLSSWLLFSGHDATWRVVGMVPPSIVRETIDTPTYYIVRQTHEPFLRFEDLQNYTSVVLKDWRRSADYRKFVFYPDTDLKFNKDIRLTKEQFEAQLSSVTAKFCSEFRISSDSDSVTVEFARPQKRYLYFLTWYENAPAIRNGKFEYGLGEYYISEYTPEKIVMERKNQVRNGYNRIEFLNYTGDKDPKLQDRRIQDFNLLSAEQQPEWIKDVYYGIKNPDPRSVVLLINHPDKAVRERLYNCINVDKFRRAFFGKTKEFHDIMTVLPIGIPGAKPGLPLQACRNSPLKGTQIFSLVNLRGDNAETLPSYLRTLKVGTGLDLIERRMTYAELVKILNDSRHKPYWYNLFQIYLDTFRPDYKVFFEYTSGKKTFLSYSSKPAEKLFGELLGADDFETQKPLAEALADKLGKEALVLPLFQTYSTVYYPRNIKNIIVGNGFRQYPEVAKFRW